MAGSSPQALPARRISGGLVLYSLSRSRGGNQIIDVRILIQRVDLGERVVAHALEAIEFQVRISDELRQLGGCDELRIIMRSLGQHA